METYNDNCAPICDKELHRRSLFKPKQYSGAEIYFAERQTTALNDATLFSFLPLSLFRAAAVCLCDSELFFYKPPVLEFCTLSLRCARG